MLLNQHEKALEDADKAIEIQPDLIIAWQMRTDILITQYRLDEAEANLQKALALDPDYAHTKIAYSRLYIARDKPAQGIAALSRALEIEPDNAMALSGRAEAYAMLGELNDALTDLEKAYELQPDNWNVWFNLGKLYAELGQKDKALAIAEHAASTDEKGWQGILIHGRYAELLDRFGHKEDASRQYRETLDMLDEFIAGQPQNQQAIELKDTVLLMTGHADEAIRQISASLSKQKNNVDMLIERCRTRAHANIELVEALQDCGLAFKYKPGDYLAVKTRGLVHLRLSNWDDAIKNYDAVVKFNPRDATAYYGRDIARLRKGDRDNADKDFALARRYSYDAHYDFDYLGIML